MGRIPEDTIRKVMDYSDIVDIISEFVPLKKSGRNHMGVCPFHGDKGPSMSVSSEKQLYHCFGCGSSGNVIGFIMKLRNIEYIDAIKYLADRANIKLEEEDEDPKKLAQRLYNDKLLQLNIDAARFFYSNLNRNNAALEYLKSRNLDEKIIKKFGIGYSMNSWDSILTYLTKKGHDINMLHNLGLIVKDTKNNNRFYDRFRHRIMFPVFDIRGRVIGFGGRVLDDSKPKYLNSPESPLFSKGTNLYGLNYAIKAGLPDKLIIVEGYMDCITMHQYGITNTCASLGTALTLEQAKLLRRYSKDIYICYDSDAAGKAATLRGLDILSSASCNVKIISIPRGKDPDEYIKANGSEAFHELIKNAIPIVDYRINRAKETVNFRDPKQKGQFIKEISQILSTIQNEVEAQAYASKIFDETGVDTKTILTNVDRARENNSEASSPVPMDVNITSIESAYKKAELLLLKFCIWNSQYYIYIKTRIAVDEFITDGYKIAAKFIFDVIERGEVVNPNDLINQFENHYDISDISKIFLDEKIEVDNNLINDLIKTIKKSNLENKIIETTVEIKKCEETKDIKKSAQLMTDLMHLQKKLTQL